MEVIHKKGKIHLMLISNLLILYHKLPTRMLNKAENIWIIQNFREERGYTQLRRDFINHCKIINKRSVSLYQSFMEVVKNFYSILLQIFL